MAYLNSVRKKSLWHYLRELTLLYCWLLFLIINPMQGAAQNPYEFSWEKDLPIGLISASTFITGNLLEISTPTLTASEIAGLDPATINSFDRSTTQNWSPNAADLSDIFLFGTGATPLLLLGDKAARKDWLVIGVMGLETVMLNDGLTSLFKGGFRRARPYVYNPIAPYDLKTERNARFSYFSGHASFSASLSFFAARVYLDYHPDSKIKPLIWSLATVLPATTAYLRIHAGKHFPTDVITGYAAGALVGYFVPVLHRKGSGDRQVSFLPKVGDTNGLQVLYTF